MNLALHIKTAIWLLGLFVLTEFCTAQNDPQVINDSISKTNSDKALILSLGYYHPFTTESSNIGKATTGRFGAEVGLQVFVYRRFFVGAFGGYYFLRVNNTDLVGNYRRSRAFNMALDLGYEFQLVEKIDVGVSIAPLGITSYRNFIRSGRVRQQRDLGTTALGRIYLNYQFNTNFSLAFTYAYRWDNVSIETAPEIQDQFENINYHNFGICFRFTIFKD